MEALIGITGKDFVLLAADRTAARSIVVMKHGEVKFRDLGASTAIAYSGEAGDAVNFAEYLQGNIRLHEMRHEMVPLSPSAVAHYARRLLADSLRSRSPFAVNMLIGGCGVTSTDDDSVGAYARLPSDGAAPQSASAPQLFWIDHLAALTRMPFAAQGYASYFVLSLMDRHYRKDMSLDEAMALLKMCLAELKTRFVANLPAFSVKIVRADSIENLVVAV